MKRRILSWFVTTVLAVSLAGCGGASTSVAQIYSSPSSALVSSSVKAYDGPLYELSLEPLPVELSTFFYITSPYAEPPFQSIALAKNWPLDGIYSLSSKETGYFYYCDTSFHLLPMEGYLSFLGTHDGYRIFYNYNGKSTLRDAWDVEIYDAQGNLFFDTDGRYYVGSMGAEEIYIQNGWFPMIDNDTGENGFLNLYTQEWIALPDGGTYSIFGGGEFVEWEGNAYQTFFSEGLAHVVDATPMRTYFPDSNIQYSDYNIVGFMREDGEFAFRFSDIEAFNGIILNETTGFLNGTCIVTGRFDDGIKVGPTDKKLGLFDRDLFYRIDTTGNIVEEVDYETFLAFRSEVFKSYGCVYDPGGRSNFCVADSVQVADGLTLYSTETFNDNILLPESLHGAYALRDANGHTWDLRELGDLHEIDGIIIAKDGTILVNGRTNEAYDYDMSTGGLSISEIDESIWFPTWFRLVYTPTAPEGFSVSDNQKQNLSLDGWPTLGEYHQQIQTIYVELPEFSMDTPLTITCTVNGESATYTPEYSDYLIVELGEETISMLSVKLHIRAAEDEEIIVACDWTDENGDAHRGYYTAELYTLSEEPVPYFLG